MNANVSFTICPNVPVWLPTKCHVARSYSSYPSETLHIQCCHLVDTIGITSRVMTGTGTFLLHFKDVGRKKKGCFFGCIFFYQIYCVVEEQFLFHTSLNICINVDERQGSRNRVFLQSNATKLDHSGNDTCTISMLQILPNSLPLYTMAHCLETSFDHSKVHMGHPCLNVPDFLV